MFTATTDPAFRPSHLEKAKALIPTITPAARPTHQAATNIAATAAIGTDG